MNGVKLAIASPSECFGKGKLVRHTDKVRVLGQARYIVIFLGHALCKNIHHQQYSAL